MPRVAYRGANTEEWKIEYDKALALYQECGAEHEDKGGNDCRWCPCYDDCQKFFSEVVAELPKIYPTNEELQRTAELRAGIKQARKQAEVYHLRENLSQLQKGQRARAAENYLERTTVRIEMQKICKEEYLAKRKEGKK